MLVCLLLLQLNPIYLADLIVKRYLISIAFSFLTSFIPRQGSWNETSHFKELWVLPGWYDCWKKEGSCSGSFGRKGLLEYIVNRVISIFQNLDYRIDTHCPFLTQRWFWLSFSSLLASTSLILPGLIYGLLDLPDFDNNNTFDFSH